jgi:hypothetical protein
MIYYHATHFSDLLSLRRLHVILRVVLACHQLLALRVVRFRWFPVDPAQYVRGVD